ncbi:MAG: hypothetical protein WCH98_00870 [Verrucomicrobiota bacterium]
MTKNALLICFALATAGLAGEPQPPSASPRLGMNLSGLSDWSTELFFVDIFKTSRAWISQQQGKNWGGGPSLELDGHGWIKRLDPAGDCFAELPFNTNLNGQHMVGVGGGETNQAMTKLFLAANGSPRMGALYKKYFDAWAESGGGLFSVWDSIEVWSKWGSWGVAEYYDTKPADSPKYQSTLDWAKSHGQKVTLDPVPVN